MQPPPLHSYDSYYSDDNHYRSRDMSNSNSYDQADMPRSMNQPGQSTGMFSTFQLQSYGMPAQSGPYIQSSPAMQTLDTSASQSRPLQQQSVQQTSAGPNGSQFGASSPAVAASSGAPSRPPTSTKADESQNPQTKKVARPSSDNQEKRPRGRPRKNTAPPPAAMPMMPAGVIAFSAHQVLMAPQVIPISTFLQSYHGDTSTSDGSPAKRPRGRPRKNPFPSPFDAPPNAIASSSSLPHIDSSPQAQFMMSPELAAKKIRGRPRKTPFDATALPDLINPATWSSTPIAALKDYVSKLNAHIASTEARTGGNPGTSLSNGESLYPALSRHSTFRPDLINHDIGRSEAQVRQYLSHMQSLVPGSQNYRAAAGISQGESSRGTAPAMRQLGQDDLREEDAVAAVLLLDAEAAAEAGRKRRQYRQSDMAWGTDLDQGKFGELSTLSVPNDPLAGNKAAKYQRDEQAYAALLAIPLESRSAAQTAEIRRLRDRKAMRMKYRHNKLLAEGMTAEQIEAQGGPDAIYLTRKPVTANQLPVYVSTGAPDDPLKGNKHAKIMRDEAQLKALLELPTPNADELAESRRLINKKRARQRIRKRKLIEEGMTEEEIGKIDVDEYFATRAGLAWSDDKEDASTVPPLGDH